MKKYKTKFFMCLSILFVGLLICTSSLNIVSSKALLDTNENHFTTDSFDYSNWEWTTTEVISTESSDYSGIPSIAVDSAGNVHVAWSDLTDYAGSGIDADIFYKNWNASTFLWSTTEVVSTESTDSSWFSSLAVDTLGNVHLAWEDETDYLSCGTDKDIFYKHWNYTSSSWSITELVSTESTGESDTPSLTVDSIGNLYVAWSDQTDYLSCGTDKDIFYKNWNASTFLWTTTEVVSTESTDLSSVPSLAIDAFRNVHVTWDDRTDYVGSGGDRDIFYKKWDVVISSWTTTEVVSSESTSSSSYPFLAVDTFGNVHIAWFDSTDYLSCGTDDDIFYKRWDALTSLWTTTDVVSTESTDSSVAPRLAADPAGTVHITWWDNTNILGAGIDVDIFYKRWDALSSLWTGTELMSLESTDQSWDPALATDFAGNIHIVWHDYTNYTNCGLDDDIFYKLFTGPPPAPELSPILPNPLDIATVFLDWNDVPSVSLYYIYRSTSNILSVEGLTPVGSTVTSFYEDTLSTSGTFYYVIVANNFNGNSTPSNCWSIVYIPVVYEYSTISGMILGTFTFLIVIMITYKRKSKKN